VTALTEWENFCVIVGSSAGALIGLQFVVMTLVADKRVATSEALGSAFGTPNIISAHHGMGSVRSQFC
jgi:hypothetical protein